MDMRRGWCRVAGFDTDILCACVDGIHGHGVRSGGQEVWYGGFIGFFVMVGWEETRVLRQCIFWSGAGEARDPDGVWGFGRGR